MSNFNVITENSFFILPYIYFYLVNNYEISHIIIRFLKIWENYHIDDYIDAQNVINKLNLSKNKILVQYFSYCDYKVKHDDFLQFIIIFAFFDIHNIIRLLLYVSGNHSNLNTNFV